MAVKVHNEIRMEQPCSPSNGPHVLGLMLHAVTGELCVLPCLKTTLTILDFGGRVPLSRFWPSGEHNQSANAGV